VSVVGEKLQPTLFERGRPGRGGGKIPHPAPNALDRIPAAARIDLDENGEIVGLS
jgi:hypothetical protein